MAVSLSDQQRHDVASILAAMCENWPVGASDIDGLIETIDAGVKDLGPAWTSSFGVSGARYTSNDRSGSAASVTDAPASGKKLVITDVLISVDTAMRVDLKEETSGTIIASIYLPANGACQWTPRSKTKLATADKKLQVQTSAAGNIAVTAHYYSEA